MKYFFMLFLSMMFFTKSYKYHLNRLKEQFLEEHASINKDIQKLEKKYQDFSKLEELKDFHNKYKTDKYFNPKIDKLDY